MLERRIFRQGRWILLLGLLLATAAPTVAADGPMVESKPFAEKFLVLQLSDSDPHKQDLVLSVASNLLEHYGPDLIDIEIVAFAGGMDLLLADNERSELIDSLAAQGVRFIGCGNTIETIVRRTGERPEFTPHMEIVQAGAARILERVEQGYTLIRP